MHIHFRISPRKFVADLFGALTGTCAAAVSAQGFDKINTTVTNVNTILVTISVAVVTIAIMWAGYKMIFQSARLADVSNILIGGTCIGGGGAFAPFIVGWAGGGHPSKGRQLQKGPPPRP